MAEKDLKDVGLRVPEDFHQEFMEFLKKLNEKELGKVTKRQYAFHALKEQIKRDKERLGIQ